MPEEDALKIFEEKHVIPILFYIYREGPSKKSDIYGSVSTNPRMPLKLDMMERAGLITQSIDTINNNTTTVSLTEKGEIIVKKLSGIIPFMGK